jgi:starvation-inducible DNA-binding protein
MTNAPQSHHRGRDGEAALDAEGLRRNLRMIPAYLFDLHLLGSQAHGHVRAANSLPALQFHLDSIIQTAREASNTLGERLHALDARSSSNATSTTAVPGPPPGERSTAAMLDRIAHRIVTLVDIIGWVDDRVDSADSSTAELLRAITDAFEMHAWVLNSDEFKAQGDSVHEELNATTRTAVAPQAIS